MASSVGLFPLPNSPKRFSYSPLPTNPKKIGVLESPRAKVLAARISPIALKALLELGVAISLNLVVLSFIVNPLTAPLSIVFLNPMLIASFATVVVKTAWEIYNSSPSKGDTFTDGVRGLAKTSIANCAGLAGPIPAIHECGHVIAASALFKEPNIKVTINPFKGGNTSYTVSKGLTKVGEFLGKENAILLTTAAGFMASTFFAMFEFGLAYHLKEQYPNLSECLNHHAIAQILNDVVYALTTFFTHQSNLGHDFMRLWQVGGVHPLIPIAFMIILPLIELYIIKLLAARRQAEKVQDAMVGLNFYYQ